jgi:hypothetical protein
MTIKRMHTLQPPSPSDNLTHEEALVAVAKVQGEENARIATRRLTGAAAPRVTPGAEEADKPALRMRTLQPPHPGASITLEQAIQASVKVKAEKEAREASKLRGSGKRRKGGESAKAR